jgi:hypothetical protein
MYLCLNRLNRINTLHPHYRLDKIRTDADRLKTFEVTLPLSNYFIYFNDPLIKTFYILNNNTYIYKLRTACIIV